LPGELFIDSGVLSLGKLAYWQNRPGWSCSVALSICRRSRQFHAILINRNPTP
jgi:hypothetical protein